MRNLRSPRWTAAAALLLAGFVIPPSAETQESYAPRANFETRRVVSLGYVANAPNAFYGGGLAVLNPTFFGVFADVKSSGRSPSGNSNFMPDWTVNQALNEFGDFFYSREDEWLVVNGGLTRVVGPELAVYAGLGYTRRRAFEQYEDPSGERGEFGYYWVEADDLSGSLINALGGVYFRAGSNLIFQFGVEAQPRGMTVGIHYALPFTR